VAKVLLDPIGSSTERMLDGATLAAQRSYVDALNAELREKRDEVRAGWGPEYHARVRKKGKLPTWDRIDRLKDEGSPVLPIGTLVNYGRTFGEDKKTSPGAGVVTAFLRVNGRWIVVIANDNTVASGSWWPQTPEKIQRAQEVALRLKLPVVYMVDCSGLFLPEQAQTFPGRTGAGAIFKMNALLSAQGVPQIAGVHGDCIAGGGYMPIISDVVYMTEQAYMVVAGAALVKGGKAQHITSLSIGGPDVHVHLSRCADHRVPDDETLIDCLRREVAKLPGPAWDFYRYGAEASEPRFSPSDLDALFPSDHRLGYDTREVLARLTDHSLFGEFLPDTGHEMICGVARVSGLYTGFVANNLALTDHPVHRDQKRPGGILYREGIAKVAQFSRCCNDDGIPVVWLQDISGFDIGPEAEKQGLLGFGSSLIYTNTTNTVPMFTVLLRKASGAGYYAMEGLPYGPVLQLATPLARLAVMEGRTLAIGAYNTRLDDAFRIVAKTPEEAEEIRRGMQAVEDRIARDMNPLVAASQRDVDEIVQPSELRLWIQTMVQMAYQATGHRRIKNPRIWSLHDMNVIRG
jgi:3-methylcrotonyl-CoA carboxylase beta subunit